MADARNLKARLDALDAKIRETQERLKLKRIFHKEHELTSEELLKRHNLLKQQLEQEIADEEAHGHHVDLLEEALREWLESLDFSS